MRTVPYWTAWSMVVFGVLGLAVNLVAHNWDTIGVYVAAICGWALLAVELRKAAA